MKKYPIENYPEYIEAQKNRTRKKWGSMDFNRDIFKKIVMDFLNEIKLEDQPKSICCMGIRNGNEYLAFQEIPNFKNSRIWGVDIFEKVKDVGPDCFCADFNKLPDEWESKFDLVYSNSIDHSFNVEETLKEWHRVAKNCGHLLLTLSTDDKTSPADIYCFARFDLEEILDGKLFAVEKIWEVEGQENGFNLLLKVKK